jgi:hypothetical protein
MPDKLFLESYPLYRKLSFDVPALANGLLKVRINMACKQCQSNQTFEMINEYWEINQTANHSVSGQNYRLRYRCTHCLRFERLFFVVVGPELKWLMKVGQFPTWEITGDPNIERLLGTHADYYHKGLVCESQGYGIGAFGYYRRIVEEVIDGLLDEISYLLSGPDLVIYQSALEKTKQTFVAQEKIELVKELLPPILRPSGMNPLAALHSSLSQGLHADSEESCLEQAGACREVLVFLLSKVAATREASKTFTDSMKKLLDKKAKTTA